MLERLALVIHWIGFIIGVWALVGVVFMMEENLAFGALSFMVPHTCGWLVKFIFTGNGSFFPWQS
jgi:hypothetical protein